MIKYLLALVLSITTGNAPVDSNLHPAVRLNNAYQESPLPPPPLNPEGLTGCAEMEWYRVNAGLPSIFDQLGNRESRCNNDVKTFCCYGYWQNYLSSHLSESSRYRERIINDCGVTRVSDIFGLSPEQKSKQACVTFVVYSISGLIPWSK